MHQYLPLYTPTPVHLNHSSNLAAYLRVWDCPSTDSTRFLPKPSFQSKSADPDFTYKFILDQLDIRTGTRKTQVIDGAKFDYTAILVEIRTSGYDIIVHNTFLPSRDAKMVTILVEQAYELKFPDYDFG